ncbi:MAG TPA: hypothetical protein VEX17_01555, partial [Bacillales bacterium]|nr:hypothetical protein [Bacillales bacterium]
LLKSVSTPQALSEDALISISVRISFNLYSLYRSGCLIFPGILNRIIIGYKIPIMAKRTKG